MVPCFVLGDPNITFRDGATEQTELVSSLHLLPQASSGLRERKGTQLLVDVVKRLSPSKRSKGRNQQSCAKRAPSFLAEQLLQQLKGYAQQGAGQPKEWQEQKPSPAYVTRKTRGNLSNRRRQQTSPPFVFLGLQCKNTCFQGLGWDAQHSPAATPK